MKLIKYTLYLLLITYVFCENLHAKKLKIVTPYLGTIKNTYKNDKYFDLEDTALLKGLYLQVVDSKKYQSNLFLYGTDDINHSAILGSHFIFDYYLNVKESSKNVVGAGINVLNIDMETSREFFPVTDFDLTNRIYSPYIRAGRYFYFQTPCARYSVMPWIGYEYEIVKGDISGRTTWYPFVLDEEIDEEYRFLMLGLNLTSVISHFFEVKIKYYAKIDSDNVLQDISCLGNMYLNRSWALSYRLKYFENTDGFNLFNVFGVAYTF